MNRRRFGILIILFLGVLSTCHHIFGSSLIRSIRYCILGDGGITYVRSKALLSPSRIDSPGTAGAAVGACAHHAACPADARPNRVGRL